MLQSIITYIRKSLLTRRFSHCLILPKKISVRRAKVTLGRLKQNSCWQHLTILMTVERVQGSNCNQDTRRKINITSIRSPMTFFFFSTRNHIPTPVATRAHQVCRVQLHSFLSYRDEWQTESARYTLSLSLSLSLHSAGIGNKKSSEL